MAGRGTCSAAVASSPHASTSASENSPALPGWRRVSLKRRSLSSVRVAADEVAPEAGVGARALLQASKQSLSAV